MGNCFKGSVHTHDLASKRLQTGIFCRFSEIFGNFWNMPCKAKKFERLSWEADQGFMTPWGEATHYRVFMFWCWWWKWWTNNNSISEKGRRLSLVEALSICSSDENKSRNPAKQIVGYNNSQDYHFLKWLNPEKKISNI